MSTVKNNIISWDYDGTLDHHFGGHGKNIHIKETRDYVIRLIRRGYKVFIITRRYGPENSNMGLKNEHLQVWKTADELGISRKNIIFTNREWKYSFIKSIGACMHIDDDEREKYWIERHLPGVKMIWLENPMWENELISVIDSHDSFKIWFGNSKNVLKLGIYLILALFAALLLL